MNQSAFPIITLKQLGNAPAATFDLTPPARPLSIHLPVVAIATHLVAMGTGARKILEF